MNLLRSFAVAFAMYSKIPVPNVEWNGKSMKYAMCFFPAVGAVAGFFQFLAGYLIMNHTDCGKFFFSAVMVLIPVVVTGGIHLDGYADTVDALSSYGEREKKLEILKDPHTGAFALIWVCVWFVADLALWSEVSADALAVLACTYVFSRSLSERNFGCMIFNRAKQRTAAHLSRRGAQETCAGGNDYLGASRRWSDGIFFPAYGGSGDCGGAACISLLLPDEPEAVRRYNRRPGGLFPAA